MSNSEIYLTRDEIEHPYANLAVMLENKRKAEQMSKTVFASGDALRSLKNENKALEAALRDISTIGFEGKIGDTVAREIMRRIANAAIAEKGGRG